MKNNIKDNLDTLEKKIKNANLNQKLDSFNKIKEEIFNKIKDPNLCQKFDNEEKTNCINNLRKLNTYNNLILEKINEIDNSQIEKLRNIVDDILKDNKDSEIEKKIEEIKNKYQSIKQFDPSKKLVIIMQEINNLKEKKLESDIELKKYQKIEDIVKNFN